LRFATDATHIFDGLDGFPTHVAHMRDGSFVTNPVEWPAQPALASSLHSLALQWLMKDRTIRTAAEATGERRKRGARTGEVRYS
jgi:CCR4-NOT complex subunit CAF16